MRKMVLGTLAVVIFCGTLLAWGAGYIGMVLENTAEGVKVNRGEKDAITQGQVLYVVRRGELVGKLEVVKVEDYRALAKVVESKAPIEKGDAIYDVLPESSQPPPSQPSSPSTKSSSAEGKGKQVATTGASREAESAKPSGETGGKGKKKSVQSVKTNQYTKEFEKTFKTRTKVVQFKAGSGAKMNISIVDLMQFYNAVQVSSSTSYSYDNYIGSGVVYPNWWPIASEVGDIYGRYNYSNAQNRRTHTNLQITYWDEELLNKFSAYFAYKETQSDDPAKKDFIKQSINRDKGIDRYYVFEVVINNGGPGLLQLAPFNWHLYLVDGNGNRYKAEKYDQILDKALNPGQNVRGLVYFARKDAAGNAIGGGAGATLRVEDIMGESANVTW